MVQEKPKKRLREGYAEPPDHLENENWFASVELTAISEESNRIILTTWRRTSADRAILSVIELQEGDTITWVDGETE